MRYLVEQVNSKTPKVDENERGQREVSMGSYCLMGAEFLFGIIKKF